MEKNKIFTIIHIAEIKVSSFSGVSVVVPQHVNAQKKYANVAFVNVNNVAVPDIEVQYKYDGGELFSNMDAPFSDPDLVVFHEVYHTSFLKIAFQLKGKKIPYIIIPHGCLTTDALMQKKMKKKIANVLIFKKFINSACGIQCLSERELLSTKFGKYKFLGTNGVSVPKKRKTEFSNEELKIVYIGRLDPYHKGLDLLLNAISKEKEYLKEKKCFFYLYGPYYERWNSFLDEFVEKHNISNLVSINREIANDEKEKVLMESDIFIQTSRYEGMPLGILEALSYGVPCFVTDGTTLGDLILQYDAGFVTETSTESIAKAFHYMIEKKDKLKIKSLNAIQLVEEKFSWDLIAHSTIVKYLEIIR